MRKSVVKAKLRAGSPVLLTSCALTDPAPFELTSLMGFDGIWVDMEHASKSLETVSTLVRAARAGQSDVMVRPANGEFMRISRLLEAGAQGIMYPRCRDAAEAADVVRWAKFAPLGTRGFDGSNPDQPYLSMDVPEYIRQANEETFVVVQIEDEEAIEAAAEIAAVEGVDVLFFGPGDYSILSGFPGQFDHPQLNRAMHRIAEAAREAGKHWGMPVADTERARAALDMGATFLASGVDVVWIKRGLEQLQAEFSELGFRFDNRLPDKAVC
jgi:4-hydroxy-2-oxoheptanedioate aldolase